MTVEKEEAVMRNPESNSESKRRVGGAVRAALLVAVLILVGAAIFAGTGLSSSSAPPKDKWTRKLKDGTTFHLSAAIKAKLAAHKPINYVFSYGSSGIQGFSQQFIAGYRSTLAGASKIYPLTGHAIAPPDPTGNIPLQISQIRAFLNTKRLDCLSVQPSSSTTFGPLINQIMHKGIPVFTVGLTTNSDEFTNFTQVPFKEGRTAAATVLAYMKAHNLSFKTFAVSGGDPTQFYAHERARGFRTGILAAIPAAKFVNDENNILSVTFDPAKGYDAYKAFLTGVGNGVDVIENVDIGAAYADKAISDAGLKGKVFTVGWNVTPEQIDAIKNGIQIALFDQKWWQQAGFGATACATFLKTGRVIPNTQTLQVINVTNYKQAQAALDELLRKHGH
jgi:ribose transport system substrate-binding protein